jgi:hypothetical protein
MALSSGYSRRRRRSVAVVTVSVAGVLLLSACGGQDNQARVVDLSIGGAQSSGTGSHSGPVTPVDSPTPSAVSTVVARPGKPAPKTHRKAGSSAATTTTATSAGTGSSAASGVPAAAPGWKTDFFDGFNGTRLNTADWGAYNGKPSNNSVSTWRSSMVSVSGGALHLKSERVNGQWVTAGVSSANAGAFSYGKWTVRYKVQKAAGIAYVILLYPVHGWPPEYDIAEDGSGGNRTEAMSTLHWGSSNSQQHAYLKGNFSKWVTVTETSSPGVTTIAVNGKTQVTMHNAYGVPSVPMWMGIQTQVNRCSACATASTPSSVGLDVDYVSHQKYVG